MALFVFIIVIVLISAVIAFVYGAAKWGKRFFYVCSYALLILIAFVAGINIYNKQFSHGENANEILRLGITRYTLISNSYGGLVTFGKREFVSRVRNEKLRTYKNIGNMRLGMYSVEGDKQKRHLNYVNRHLEWSPHNTYYRKASLPELNLAVESFVRIEFLEKNSPELFHMSCGGGITDPAELKRFIDNMTSREISQDKWEDMGDWERRYGYIYGYFEGEPNLAVQIEVRKNTNGEYGALFWINNAPYVTTRLAKDTRLGYFHFSKEWIEALKEKQCNKEGNHGQP
jgi:hypothetical protein